MSKSRELRRRAKTPIISFLRQIARKGRQLRKQGRDPSRAVQELKKSAYSSDRGRWKRWHKANKLLAARRRALRRAGCNVANLPANLPMFAVR